MATENAWRVCQENKIKRKEQEQFVVRDLEAYHGLRNIKFPAQKDITSTHATRQRKRFLFFFFFFFFCFIFFTSSRGVQSWDLT